MTTESKLEKEKLIILKWKYDSTDESIIFPYLIKPTLDSVAKLIPYSVSANIITLLGFMFTIINFILCVYKVSNKIEFTLIDNIIIAINSLTAYYLDALDGCQGRKWKKDKRDIYVLTQLFDHGFDSMTAILNTLIMGKALKFDSFYTFIVFGMLNYTFMISSLDYKIHKKMFFGFFSNPTESVVTCNLIVILVGYVGHSIKIINYIFLAIFIGNIITNLTTSLKGFKYTKHKEEKYEIIINFFLIGLTFLLKDEFLNDDPKLTQRKVLYYVCYSLILHIASLNYIAHEILYTHCYHKNLLLLVLGSLPIILPKSVETSFMYILCGALVLYACSVWRNYTNKICKALGINYFWSIPKIGNNPYSE